MIRIGESESKEDIRIRDLYRRVFSTDEGRQVLTYILADLGWWDESIDERSMVLRNYGTRLLELVGILHESNAEQLISKMFTVGTYDPKNIGKEKPDENYFNFENREE